MMQQIVQLMRYSIVVATMVFIMLVAVTSCTTLPPGHSLEPSTRLQSIDWNTVLSTSLMTAGVVFTVLGAAGDGGE